ncbi:PREDICTED: LOW QUALITY PROTEIN: golgin subfamily A member 8M-like [Colobus angolensis palliatus]|uniref:LOW QUALITY PROTEIN: golgin subfamily A member 8M-like n=1 Tax=Colobus angolensis palliatus TaxID=336983 RepID=UPI0005F54020|nr:PREDICTED: LOW QUALITY PROTEIN: golgin subfamily A member 8M-like [Colobus angolensis palliatus]
MTQSPKRSHPFWFLWSQHKFPAERGMETLKEYWQRNSPGGPAGAKKNRKTNGSSPETATSGGCHSPGDSATGIDGEGPTSSAPLKDLESLCQELPAALDSRSIKINQLSNIIKSLEQQKKQVEHQLEEEKKANNKKQKTERELEVQIQRLNRQIEKLHMDMYHTERSLIYFEEESKDLSGRLQHTVQCIGELERALSAVPATQEEKEISFSSRSQALIEWQLEQSIQEKAQLRERLIRMRKSLKQVQLERDEYAQHLKGERARWQDRMRKMWQEVCTLKKDKKDDTRRVEELKRSLSKLKNQMAEPLHPEPPAVHPEEELQHLRKELERVSAELQAQVENHQHVRLLNQAQKERLREQENNENKSTLQVEQQAQELLEKLYEVKETVELKRQEAQSLQQQPDHYLGHLQQSMATYQQQVAAYLQLTSEKEALHRQLLQQTQLLNQLQQQESWGKPERLEAASQQSQQLNAPLNHMALPGEGTGDRSEEEERAPGGRGDCEQHRIEELEETFRTAGHYADWMPALRDGGGQLDSEEEDLDSWEAMSGIMDHREETAVLSELVKKQELRLIHYWRERCHQNVRHLVTEAGGSAEDAAMGGGQHQAGPAQGGDEGEAAGAAGDAVVACATRNNKHSKFLAAAQNPADEPSPGAPPPQELGAADQHGDLCEVSLTDSAEPAQEEAKEGSPKDDPTAQPIVQDHQEHPGLGSNRSVPFFCWAWLRRRRR